MGPETGGRRRRRRGRGGGQPGQPGQGQHHNGQGNQGQNGHGGQPDGHDNGHDKGHDTSGANLPNSTNQNPGQPRHPQHNQPHHQRNNSGSLRTGRNAQRNSQPRGPILPHRTDIDGRPLPPAIRRFDELTTIDPQPRLTLEYPGCPASCRLIDLFCPIGRGQRALIVSPPKAGKTTLLKDMATAILRNHPDVEVVVLLVDERPEEVTDFRRTFVQSASDSMSREMLARGESFAKEAGVPDDSGTAPGQNAASRCRVVASSNDHQVDKHIEVAISTIDRCKRMVESGKHVVVLMDSLTRVGRAFNNSRRFASSGRTLSGGLDSKALEVPRQLFGSARNTEEAGSLTIIASCLVDTGSQADQVIFEEFKGSGNMELILDRKVAERRLFPAINLAESGTRKEHLLLTEGELKTMSALRRQLLAMHPHEQVERLLAALKRFPTNAALVGSAG
jgi:transcription termination factor Rho